MTASFRATATFAVFAPERRAMRMPQASGMHGSIRDTRSCANARSATIQFPHCGECSQCVDRRLAVAAADAEPHNPGEAYKVDLFVGARPEGPKRALAVGMVGAARAMHRHDDMELCSAFPEIARAVQACDGSADQAATRILGLARRHGQAVLKALEKGVSGFSADPVIAKDELPLPEGAVIEHVPGHGYRLNPHTVRLVRDAAAGGPGAWQAAASRAPKPPI